MRKGRERSLPQGRGKWIQRGGYAGLFRTPKQDRKKIGGRRKGDLRGGENAKRMIESIRQGGWEGALEGERGKEATEFCTKRTKRKHKGINSWSNWVRRDARGEKKEKKLKL